MVGFALRDEGSAIVPAFVVITALVGVAARFGREPLIVSRDGAMAFAVASGLPILEGREIAFFLGALAVTLMARLVDHLLFGALPALPPPPLRPAPPSRAHWNAFAISYTAASTLAFVVGRGFDAVHAVWVVTTTLVVMQPDARASMTRILERVGGTIVGVAVAWAMSGLAAGGALPLVVAIVVVAAAVPHYVTTRYWLHTALSTVLVFIAYELALLGTDGLNGLFAERVEDMLLGSLAAVLGTLGFVVWWRLRDAVGDAKA